MNILEEVLSFNEVAFGKEGAVYANAGCVALVVGVGVGFAIWLITGKSMLSLLLEGSRKTVPSTIDEKAESKPEPNPETNASPQPKTWFCRTGEEEIGPLTFDQLAALASSGVISTVDHVKQTDMGKWQPSISIKGLF